MSNKNLSVNIPPTVVLDNPSGQHYEPFELKYHVLDNDPNISVEEYVDGELVNKKVLDNKEETVFVVGKDSWRALAYGKHKFDVLARDIEGEYGKATYEFEKVNMPWYGTSKDILITGVRKPLIETIDLKRAKLVVFDFDKKEKAHILQMQDGIEQRSVKERLENGEFLLNKVTQSDDNSLILHNEPLRQLVLSKKDVNLSNVKKINGFEYVGEGVRIVFSFDGGVSWKGKFDYESNQYIDLNIDDIDSLVINSIEIGNDMDLNPIRLNEIVFSRALRIGYVLTSKTAVIDEFKMNANINGIFSKVNDSKYEVAYTSDTSIRVTFLEEGTYKVNYISGELSEDEYTELTNALKEVKEDLLELRKNGVPITIPDIDLAYDLSPMRYNTKLEYDGDKLVKEVYSGDTDKTIEYKYSGDLITKKIVTVNGITKESIYKYDEFNRLVQIIDEGTENTKSAGVIGMPLSYNVSFTYDGEGRAICEEYTGTINKKINYEYLDSLTKKQTVIYKNGETATAIYKYNQDGRLISVEDGGVEKIYTPLNKNAITTPKCISNSESIVYFDGLTKVLDFDEILKSNNLIINSEFTIKCEYNRDSNHVARLLITQDGMILDDITLYPQEVQKYTLGTSIGTEVMISGRVSYSYTIGVI